MTIQDVARSEDIGERQAQRYCRAPGYKGHVLKAVRVGRGLVIAIEDYKAWRVECGFDFLPQQDTPGAAPPQEAGGLPPGSPDEGPGGTPPVRHTRHTRNVRTRTDS